MLGLKLTRVSKKGPRASSPPPVPAGESEVSMMTPWHGMRNSLLALYVGESTSDWWIIKKNSKVEFDVFVCVYCLSILLKTQLSCRWFETSLCPYDVTVMSPGWMSSPKAFEIMDIYLKGCNKTCIWSKCLANSITAQYCCFSKNASPTVSRWLTGTVKRQMEGTLSIRST